MQYWMTGIILVICLGCKSNSRNTSGEILQPVILKYAEQIVIDSCEKYKLVCVRNPWDTTKILSRYILLDREQTVPDELPEGIIVRVPLQKALIYSSVHCGLLQELGALEQIGGVCDLQYIDLADIQKRCADHQIVDAGNSMNPDIEKIIDFHPDAILLSPFENSGGYGRVEKLGIPIIECADYMETSPLGRAEWVRFFGLLFGRQKQADSLFAAVNGEYLRLRELVKDVKHRPTVIAELKSVSAWYIPGGKSTLGRLYQDAGAVYLWAEDGHSGSVPLSFETVYNNGHDAEFWLFKYNQAKDKTLAELKADYAPYTGFRAFRTGQVYGCNSNKVPFYEETPFHPERLLQDMIRIFHPQLGGKGECRYFKKLEK